jgi:branched-chain amino acid transport system permease protein
MLDRFNSNSSKPNAVRILAIVFFATALLFALIGTVMGDSFYIRLATEALIFGGLALSVDLLLGHVGLLPLGQALFFGLGAYVSAVVLKEWAASFWLAIIVSMLFCAFAGLIGGLIAIRSKGVYFALISFGLAQVFSRVIYNTRELGASDGMTGVPVVTVVPGLQTDNPLGFFFVTWLVIGGLYLVLRYVMQTPMGRLFGAIRVNEHRVCFLSGALYPMLRGFVSPELMFFQVSGNAVVNVIIGGSGTLIGALYGAGLLTVLKSILGSFTVHHHIVIGLLFVVVVIAFPRGIVGYLVPVLEARLSKKKTGDNS